MGDALHHEPILHVDDEKRGLARVEIVEDVLAAAVGDNVVDNIFRNFHVVHAGPPS